MTAFTSSTIIVRGKKVRYFTNGIKGENPLVMLHGFMSDAGSLVSLGEHMSVNQPIIIPDLPGFGESEALDSSEGLKAYVEWCKEFMKEMNVDTPSAIIGYSFGAYIAVLYTSLFTQAKKTKLILLTPVVKIDWRVHMYGRGFRFASIKSRKTAERLYNLQHDMTTRYLSKVKHPSVKNNLIDRRREELVNLNMDIVLRYVGEFLEFDLMPYAARIKVPTVIVTASKDNVAANSATHHFAELIKKPVITIEILHAGHLLPIEEPVLLATTLKNYLLEAPGLSTGPTKLGRQAEKTVK